MVSKLTTTKEYRKFLLDFKLTLTCSLGLGHLMENLRILHNSNQPPLSVFRGLRVAITGGTSGLGLALVRELLGREATLAFVSRGREGGERVERRHAGTQCIVC